MDILKIWNDNPSDRQARDVANLIAQGELVIIPTDSVYAIVCDALNPKAIEALCRLKGLNPDKNNLSILCSDISMAADYAHIENQGFRLLKQYTPGPFTFLFRAGRNLPRPFKWRKTAGVRIPDSLTARKIVEALGHPLLTTSIIFDDSDEAREPELIAERYASSGVALTVDAGPGGEEYSTIVDCTDDADPHITRQGKGQLD